MRIPSSEPAGHLIFRANAALPYFNADTVESRITAQVVRATESIRCFILDLSRSCTIEDLVDGVA